jgi:aminoglycoside 3-N-acetyltransferase
MAGYICNNVSRHSRGLETPKDRLLKLDALYVSVGLEPNKSFSIVHHAEMMMGVPYRYTKEFMCRVKRNNGVVTEPFYHFVYYKDCDLKRNLNVKILNHFIESGHILKQTKLGRGRVYSASLKDYFYSTVNYLKKDIYGWLDEPPSNRPYKN